jgi:hypothetical protein
VQFADALFGLPLEGLGVGREVGVLVAKSSSEISPVSSTRTSVCSRMYLHTRYMPMEARMVVMS